MPSRQPPGGRRDQAEAQDLGRGSAGSDLSDIRTAPEKVVERDQEPRFECRDRSRKYNLRESEVASLVEISKFRTVRTEDLAEILYKGDSHRATQDLRSLTAQGFIRRRTLDGTEKDQLLTVTRPAKDFLQTSKPQGLHRNQALYHGFVKPREARHDATLYRLYHKAAQEIERHGGRKLRVILDFELKRKIYCQLAKSRSLPPSQQADHKKQVAEAHGLRVVDGKIPLPDLRIEYETREGEQARVDLELATKDYRGHHVAEKAKAGFSIYASAEDAPRLRAGLQDPHLIADILSL